MVVRKNLEKKFALISVYNKNKLKYLCSNLIKYNYTFISSGSTGKKLGLWVLSVLIFLK